MKYNFKLRLRCLPVKFQGWIYDFYSALRGKKEPRVRVPVQVKQILEIFISLCILPAIIIQKFI